MKVIIDKKALKDLSRLDKKLAKEILNKIKLLEDFPNCANTKKLKNFYPPYRLRVGNYRILFDVHEETLTVYRVKHRKESYQ